MEGQTRIHIESARKGLEMSYEFLSEMALITDDESKIEDVINKQLTYDILKKTVETPQSTNAGSSAIHSPEQSAKWTIQSKILSTGLSQNDQFVSVLKNGRDKPDHKKRLLVRKGYPSIMKGINLKIENPWRELLLPDKSQMPLMPLGSCLLQFNLKLERPFFSKDDLAFYPMDNPLKREHILGVPYLSAAGVKGLLRWAWQMCWENTMDECEKDFFGPRQGELDDNTGQQGCLYFYPLFWNGTVGLDVINPHSRETGTGINPISYEVVKRGGATTLSLMFVNRNESWSAANNFLELIKEPLSFLIEDSGISAKRTAGWGFVEILSSKAFVKESNPAETLESSHTVDIEDISDREKFTHQMIAERLNKEVKWVKKNRSNAEEMIKKLSKPSIPGIEDIADLSIGPMLDKLIALVQDKAKGE